MSPIDGLDKPFYAGQVTYLDQDSQNAAAEASQAALEAKQTAAENPPVIDKPVDEAKKFEDVLNLRKNQIEDLRTFRKYAVNRIKTGRVIRPFVSSVLPIETVEELNKAILSTNDVSELRKMFDEPIKEITLLSIDAALETRNEVLHEHA